MKSITNSLLLSFLLLFCFNSVSQICYHTVANGLWSSPASWNLSGVPPVSLPVSDTIIVDHTMIYDVNQEVLGLMIITSNGSITGTNSLFIGLGGVNSGELINNGSITIDELHCVPDDCIVPYAPVDPFPVVNNFGIITAANTVNIGQNCGSGSLYNHVGGQIFTDELDVEGYLCNQDSIFAVSEVEVEGGVIDCCGYIETPSIELEQNGLPDRPAHLMCQMFCTNLGTTPIIEIDGLIVVVPIVYTNPIPDQGLVDALTTFCLSTLPVELVSFEAQVNSRGNVVVNWTTSSEINNDYFTVERSVNGRNWEVVGVKKGAGSSQQLNNYSMIDYDSYFGVSYYRLIQTDFNGVRKLYKIVSVDNNNLSNDFTIYPNPAVIHLYVQGDKISIESISLYSALGENLASFVDFTSINKRKVMIDVSNLPNGIYFIREGERTLKFIKK